MKMREFHNIIEMLRDLGHDIVVVHDLPDDGVRVTHFWIPIPKPKIYPDSAPEFDQHYYWHFRVRRSNVTGPKKVRRT